MKNILVTGGAGFIGSHMCEALLAEGHSVTCLDNLSTGNLDNIRHLRELDFIEGDVNDKKTWRSLKKESFDVIFHYAATVGVRRTEENPTLVLNDIKGIRYIADFAKAGMVRKIIFASSSEVYGNSPHQPLTEHAGYNASTPYSAVKIYGEHLYHSLTRCDKIPTVSLRFFNVYGPRQIDNAYGFVVAKFIHQVLDDHPPTVYGNGRQTRDFVYIEDNIRAGLAAMSSLRAEGQIFNVGTGHETTILELAKHIIKAAGKEHFLSPLFVTKRTFEIQRRCADTKHSKRLLGVAYETKLEDGIQLLLQHEQQRQLEAATKPVKEKKAQVLNEALGSHLPA